MVPRLLIVDDKKDLARGIALNLEDLGAEIATVHSAEDAVGCLEAGSFELVLSDIRMPGMDGLALLEIIKARWPRTEIILFTAYGSIDSAVEAMKKGAYHYLTKPFSGDELLVVVERALEDVRRKDELLRLRAEILERNNFHGIVGKDRKVAAVFETIRRVCSSACSVMICGESGTGKELVVRALHAESPRRAQRFVAFNAAAMPDNLAEAELFGARKGAYTGADRDRPGLFVEASGGTLFIDELASMSHPLQGKLLRVLQEGEVLALGAARPTPVDVRVVSATNEDPQKLIRDGQLRRDLYYRLSVVRIAIPALRDRIGDVPLLAECFLARHATATGTAAKPLSSGAMRVLMSHSWPGNVRELQNVIERAVLLSQSDEIVSSDIELEEEGAAGFSQDAALPYEEAKARVVEQFQRRYVERALEESGGSIARAARRSGITRAAFYRMLKRLGLRGDGELHEEEPSG
ncbi:MAG: sigma-54-dependent Fis family transcriptional regulator [Deltaproteobacteria bacterium]|nr:sigma-54-dependent Fis family transcriptional regulator [Deltaproteobacteria bacterium]